MANAVLEIIDVKKSFGKKAVHEGVSFSLYQGEVLSLIGGSGCGKSVLLRSIIGLEQPDFGSIRFHGDEILRRSERDWVETRKRIAFVFQYGALFDSLTIYENLAYPLREHTLLTEKEIEIKIKISLLQVGLSDCENLFPSDLSGGMQRRVGVARSIIINPEVVLYDEPTTGLDPYNIRMIQKIIMDLKNSGSTAILVTHDMGTVLAVSDRVAFLKDGKLHSVVAKDEISHLDLKDKARQFMEGFAP